MTSALSTKGLPLRQLSKSVRSHSSRWNSLFRRYRQSSMIIVGKATVYRVWTASNCIKCTSGSSLSSGLISGTPSLVYKFSLTFDSTLIINIMFIESFYPHSASFGKYASKFLRLCFITDSPATLFDSLSIFAPKYWRKSTHWIFMLSIVWSSFSERLRTSNYLKL